MPERSTLEQRLAQRKAARARSKPLEERLAERRSISQIARDSVLGPAARRARAERNRELSNFARGGATGLARSGYGLAKGAAWVGDKLTGGRVDLGIRDALDRSEREAAGFYDAEGTAGTIGELAGRIVGEGATLLAGGLGTGRAIAKVAQGAGRAARIARPTARAIAAGRKGNLAQRATAQTAPFVPIDAVLGAGAVDPEGAKARRAERVAARAGRKPGKVDRLVDAIDPTTRLGGAALNVGLGAGGAAAIEAVPTIFRAARKAIDKVPSSRRKAAEAMDPSIADELRGAHRAAETDELTGVANARALKRALPAAEADDETAVTLFDANNFGRVNKIAGHDEGDRVLSEMADALKRAAAEQGAAERVFRRGGDEFVILAPKDASDRIRARATEIFGDRVIKNDATGESVVVSISGSTAPTFKDADDALQGVKAARKGAQTGGQVRPPAEEPAAAPPRPEPPVEAPRPAEPPRAVGIDAYLARQEAARHPSQLITRRMRSELGMMGFTDDMIAAMTPAEAAEHLAAAAPAPGGRLDPDDVSQFFGDDRPPISAIVDDAGVAPTAAATQAPPEIPLVEKVRQGITLTPDEIFAARTDPVVQRAIEARKVAAPKPAAARKKPARKPVPNAINKKYRLDSDEDILDRLAEVQDRLQEYGTGKYGDPVWVRFDDDQSVMLSGGNRIKHRTEQDSATKQSILDELQGRGWQLPDVFEKMTARQKFRIAERSSSHYPSERAVREQFELEFGSQEAAQDVVADVAEISREYAQISAPNLPLTSADRVGNVARAIKQARAWVDIRGQKIRGAEDAYRLLYPFRSPKAEKFHVILLDGKNRVVSHTMETSGAIDYVDLLGIEKYSGSREAEGLRVWTQRIADRATRVGAKKVVLAHNHPSGQASPSAYDASITAWLADDFERRGLNFVGHLVANHGSAGWIRNGKPELLTGATRAPGARPLESSVIQFDKKKLNLPATDWTDARADRIRTPSDVMRLVGSAHRDKGFVLLYVDTRFGTVAVESHSADAVATIPTWLPQRLSAHGAKSAFAVVDGDRLAPLARTLVRTVNDHPTIPLIDVVEDFGNGTHWSAAEHGQIASNRGAETAARKSRRVREDVSDDFGAGASAEYDEAEAGSYARAGDEAAGSPRAARAPAATVGRGEHQPAAAEALLRDRTDRVAGSLEERLRARLEQRSAADDVSAFFGDDAPKVEFSVDDPRALDYDRRAKRLRTRRGAAITPVAGTIAATGSGAAIGAALDDDDPVRGAVVGATLAGAVTYGAGNALRRRPNRTFTERALRDLRAKMSTDVETAFKQVSSGIDFSGEATRAAKKTTPRVAGRLARYADKIANGLEPIERLGQMTDLRPSRNPWDLTSYMKSSDATVARAFKTGVIDPVTRETIGPSYAAIFEPLAGNDALTQSALAYVVAKRIVGRGPAAVDGDFHLFQQMETVAGFGDANPVLRSFAQRWEDFTDAIGNYAVGSGLWTEDLWKKLKASDVLYVRFARIMDPAVPLNEKAITAKPLANVGPGIDEFIGSKRKLEEPARALADYARKIIHAADRYRIGAAVFDAVDDLGPAGELIATRIASDRVEDRVRAIARVRHGLLPDTEVADAVVDLFEPRLNKDNPVIWRNGPTGLKEHMLVHAPDLWSALMQLDVNQEGAVRLFFDLTLRPLKRIFTATTTAWSPRFSLATNPARDVVDAMAKTQANITPADIVRGYGESILALRGRSDIVDEAERFGMGNSSLFTQDRPQVAARDFAPVTRGDRIRSRSAKLAAAPIRVLEEIGTASDRGPRVAEYMAALRKFEPRVRSGEWSLHDARLRAGTLARGVTLDFANKPGNPVLHAFADYIPFFGVGLQAPVKFGQAAIRNPKRVAAVATSAAVAAVTAWALTERADKETQDDIRDRVAGERAGYLYVPVPGGAILRVPLQQEIGFIVQGITAALDHVANEDPAAGALFAATIERMLPNGMKEIAQGVVPLPGIQQVQEARANRTVFADRPIESRRLEGLPVAERRHESTSPTFDVVAEAARRIGLESVSPVKAEHVVRGVTSQATPIITKLTDPLAERVSGRAKERRVPRSALRDPLNPASAFVAPDPPPATQSERRYYDLRDRAQQARQLSNARRRARDRDGFERVQAEYGDVLQPGLMGAIKHVDAKVKEIRDREEVVRKQFRRNRMDERRARRELDQLTRERQHLIRRAMQRIEARMSKSTATQLSARP